MKKLTLFGTPNSPGIYPLRDFLQRSVVAYNWVDLSTALRLPACLAQGWAAGELQSAIELPCGKLVLNPTVEEVARPAFGLD